MQIDNNPGNKTGLIQFDETDEPLDIRYDHIFKAVFARDTPASKGALSGLVSALIGRKVIVQTITANEPPINSILDRRIRFDIACKALSGELVNIEMSFNPESFELWKLEFYTSWQYSGQGIHGIKKSFSDLAETIQIGLLDKKQFFPDEALVHSFFYYDPVNNISLGGKTKIITVELQKTDKIIDKPIYELNSSEKWSVFFEYLTNKEKRATINEILEKEEEIAMAGETLIHISRDEVERARMISEMKYILETQSIRVEAEREGHAIGHAEGHNEGLQEGENKKALEIARKMKEAGDSAEKIQTITGLSSEIICQLW